MTINLSDVVDITMNGSSVVKIEDGSGTVLWETEPPEETYFYVKNLTGSASTLAIKKSNSSAPTITVYYSTDKTTWTSMGSTSTAGITYSIPANSKIYLKATTNSWGTITYYNSITCSENYAVGGNVMSLIYGDNFIGKKVFPSSSTYNLSQIFYYSTYLKSINNLALPATTLTTSCYQAMFYGCTGITTIPSNLLPATTLATSCYNTMFYGCTGLTTIPSNLLPATTLAETCYHNMFGGCTSLTSIPSNLLPATTLVKNCYYGMFSSCTSLTSIPSNLLPATTLAKGCYSSMFSSCRGLTSIPSNLLPATTLTESCYYSMFQSCSGITKAPELPATTLANQCYNSMFKSCSSLNEITCYANDISANNCTYNWVNGVAASGIFYVKGSASWTTGTSGIPTGWNVVDDNNEYFYVENLTNSANTLSIKKNETDAPTITVYRSTDKTTWTSMGTTYGSGITYSIPANSKIYLKATTNGWCTTDKYHQMNSITCSGNYAIGGNIMSLIYGDSFIGKKVFPTSTTYNFNRLFQDSTNLKSIDNLILPATTLTGKCYQAMFYGCTGITSIPSTLLPSTTLADWCYRHMFYKCTGITSIPSNLLPATTLQPYCYDNMFSYTSISSIPSNLLPATTLAEWCYGHMFEATSITSIPSTLLHSTTTLAKSCYAGMFERCTRLTSIPSNLLPATTLAEGCYSYMFYGCTGITSVPSNLLHSTTLAEGCYSGMFYDCTSLTTIPSNLLPATTIYEHSYSRMFMNSKITKAPELPATTLDKYCYYSMFNGCSSLKEITCSANDISANNCTGVWVDGVSSTGTFYKRGSANWTTGTSGIPTGWTVV